MEATLNKAQRCPFPAPTDAAILLYLRRTGRGESISLGMTSSGSDKLTWYRKPLALLSSGTALASTPLLLLAALHWHSRGLLWVREQRVSLCGPDGSTWTCTNYFAGTSLCGPRLGDQVQICGLAEFSGCLHCQTHPLSKQNQPADANRLESMRKAAYKYHKNELIK